MVQLLLNESEKINFERNQNNKRSKSILVDEGDQAYTFELDSSG